MIWFAILLVAAAALAPLSWTLLRRSATPRSQRDAALALYRAQLAELEHDRAEGRISAYGHASALLEVQRRLLAAADLPETPSASAVRRPIIMALGLVPAFAVGLYLLGGSPGLPSEPLAARIAHAKAEMKQEDRLLAELRIHLATLDPHSEQARQGYVLLGDAEASRRNLAAAAAAWNKALAAHFDPTLAVEAAEAATEVDGHVSPATAALFRKALREAPSDAAWRPMAEKRLKEAVDGP